MNESVIEVRFEQPKDIEEVRLLNDMALKADVLLYALQELMYWTVKMIKQQ